VSRENVELVRGCLAAFMAGDLVYAVSGGRVSRQDIYDSGAQAFEAAGLPG
jgi:hypothetical protein